METQHSQTRKLKILVLLSESWNDVSAPNNNMTNWFSDFSGVELRTISGNASLPNNRCCKDYFLVGENAMMRSIFSRKKVGKAYHFEEYPSDVPPPSKPTKTIRFGGELARLARDFVWRYGKYDVKELSQFIQEFQPDVVFTQRKGSIKMCRLERIVSKITNAPMVAYTGDDEYSLKQFSLSPIYWIRRFWLRAWLKKNIPTYKLFYSQSDRQMEEFAREFKVPTKFLVKCGAFLPEKIHTKVNDSIQLVYAGKFYCNRWKTLAMIAKAIRKINQETGKQSFVLNIYTRDKVSKKQNRLLNDGVHSIIHGGIAAKELPKVYERADIALHVESFDLTNRLLTQDSFSTKVMDCMSCGCAVMAVCWEGHAAGVYLKRQDAALVANSEEEIQTILKGLAENPNRVLEYSQKAYACGVEKHERKIIQAQLRADFEGIIET